MVERKEKKKNGERSVAETVARESEETKPFRVEDRRHWARPGEGDDGDDAGVSTHPTVVDEFRRRAEDAERQLREYIAAFKKSQEDTEAFRGRLSRDVERRVRLEFGELVGELLESVDDLNRALEHARDVPEAGPLAEGVEMARDRFLATLERHGVERIESDGAAFDPNVAEAMRVDPVDDPALDGTVTETLRPGYRLGDHVIRAARVAVGRLKS